MSQPERILLIRSGRHVLVALDVLRRTYPHCHVSVIATPGTDSARIQAGLDAADWITYDAHPQFDAWPMIRSGLAARMWARGFDRVAVLWQDPDGSDRANVDRAASALSPSGFVAITPNGTLIERKTIQFVAREIVNAALSILTTTVIRVALYGPAMLVALFRGKRLHEVR